MFLDNPKLRTSCLPNHRKMWCLCVNRWTKHRHGWWTGLTEDDRMIIKVFQRIAAAWRQLRHRLYPCRWIRGLAISDVFRNGLTIEAPWWIKQCQSWPTSSHWTTHKQKSRGRPTSWQKRLLVEHRNKDHKMHGSILWYHTRNYHRR